VTESGANSEILGGGDGVGLRAEPPAGSTGRSPAGGFAPPP